MKVSTLTTMALLSASCFAAPNHTAALDSLTARAALAAARINAPPVAPPAPHVLAVHRAGTPALEPHRIAETARPRGPLRSARATGANLKTAPEARRTAIEPQQSRRRMSAGGAPYCQRSMLIMSTPAVPDEPIDLQIADVLHAVSFPANKDEIVDIARDAGASNELLAILDGLPEQDYADVDAVTRLIGSNYGPGVSV